MQISRALENSLDLIIFQVWDTNVRLERLHRREMGRFGKLNPEFMEWAGQYDEGKLLGVVV